MINWYSLAANSMWVLGLALALAAIGHASWQAAQHHEKFRTRLKLSGYQFLIDLAAMLFCLGMAATSRRAWEIILWLGLAVLFIAQAVVEKYFKKS